MKRREAPSGEPPKKVATIEAALALHHGDRERAEAFYRVWRAGLVRMITTNVYRPFPGVELVEAFETDPAVLESCRTAHAEAAARYDRLCEGLGS